MLSTTATETSDYSIGGVSHVMLEACPLGEIVNPDGKGTLTWQIYLMEQQEMEARLPEMEFRASMHMHLYPAFVFELLRPTPTEGSFSQTTWHHGDYLI